jgi:F-type H+-transporting ATPase subunit delta
MKILGGTSRVSVLTLRKALDEKVNNLSATDAAQFSNDLFTILTVLSSSVGVRRALTDNARDAAAKAELISNLFGSNISAAAQSLLATAASLRWSNPSELADAIEQIAVEAESVVADKNNELDKLEDQLFDFARVLVANRDLRQALNTAADSDAGRVLLLESVVKGKYATSTVNLLRRVVVLRRGRHIDATLAAYSHYVSVRRNRVVAHVRTAVALTPAQQQNLIAALGKAIGKTVHINVEVDPKVLGGISIRYGDEVIDGTVINRLAEASRALVG